MSRARSLTEFQSAFPDEASCAAFLFERRWPDGFVCPACGGARAAALKSRAYTYECYSCGRQTSITAGSDAPHKASVDGMVLGRAFDVDTFKRHVGAATGRSTQPPLQDGLAAGAEAAALDGRRTENLSKGWLKSIKRKSPFAKATRSSSPAMLAKSSSSGPSR